jgi:hypothetical protein
MAKPYELIGQAVSPTLMRKIGGGGMGVVCHRPTRLS